MSFQGVNIAIERAPASPDEHNTIPIATMLVRRNASYAHRPCPPPMPINSAPWDRRVITLRPAIEFQPNRGRPHTPHNHGKSTNRSAKIKRTAITPALTPICQRHPKTFASSFPASVFLPPSSGPLPSLHSSSSRFNIHLIKKRGAPLMRSTSVHSEKTGNNVPESMCDARTSRIRLLNRKLVRRNNPNELISRSQIVAILQSAPSHTRMINTNESHEPSTDGGIARRREPS